MAFGPFESPAMKIPLIDIREQFSAILKRGSSKLVWK